MTPYDETDYAMLEMAEEVDAAEGRKRNAEESVSGKGDEVYGLKSAIRRAAQQRQRRRRQYAFSRR